MNIAIVNTNLTAGGKTAALVSTFAGACEAAGCTASPYHMADLDLPACDGRECYGHPATIEMTAELGKADAIVLVSPIYNYDLNGAAKNLIELTGQSWKGKAAGLICNAGGEKSYLAPLGFVNSLAIDYRCLVSPRFVYVTREDFQADNQLAPESPIRQRLDFLAQELPILAEAAQKIAKLGAS